MMETREKRREKEVRERKTAFCFHWVFPLHGRALAVTR